MKRFKLIICMLAAFAVQAFAGDLTQSQEKAQRAVYAYLQKNGYSIWYTIYMEVIRFRQLHFPLWEAIFPGSTVPAENI